MVYKNKRRRKLCMEARNSSKQRQHNPESKKMPRDRPLREDERQKPNEKYRERQTERKTHREDKSAKRDEEEFIVKSSMIM